MKHDFNEKSTEYSAKQGKEIPVFVSKKYEQSKTKAIEIIEKYEDVEDSDFWILMNETKTKKMMYSGLIISHNGCLKINDHLDSKFVPSCVKLDKDGYRNSLVYSYCNDEQGIYEVGEVSSENCKNSYPYAMAYKRLFDRVVLKLSKLAYSGVYSDSEADEFRKDDDAEGFTVNKKDKKQEIISDKDKQILIKMCRSRNLIPDEVFPQGLDLTNEQYVDAVKRLSKVPTHV